jgi:murein DD-endopeptidase MepM/ murein hydrolase activator NlpD
MRRQFVLLILLAGVLSPAAWALPQTDPVPGGIVILPLGTHSSNAPVVLFSNNRAAVVRDNEQQWHAVIGLPLSLKKGDYKAYIKNGKEQLPLPFSVHDREYETQHLTITNKRKVEPNKEDLDRIWAESKKKKTALKTWDETIPKLTFIKPVEGRTSSQFGLKRFFNGKPRKPHGGLDIAVPEGTPIKAPADGVVLLSDNFFFSGNVVYLDHGEGVITYYAHMKKRKVKPGDKVSQGDIIGLVGMTGRVTGPHLHWGVYLNQTSVNPALFLETATAKK